MTSIHIKTISVAAIFLILATFIISPFVSGVDTNGLSTRQTATNQQVYPELPDWISEDPHYSTGAALTDINQDGWLDIVISDGNDMRQGRLNVYYNNGDGTFPEKASWQSDDIAYNGHLDIGDVNGDGWPDVAVSHLGEFSTVAPIAKLYINENGELSNLPVWSSDVQGNAFGVDFGDMNNDGRPDLAVATGWSYHPQHFFHNYVYLNINGSLESTASWTSSDEHHYMGAHWVDADDDGWHDLAFIGTGQDTVVYRNVNGILEQEPSWETIDSAEQDGIMLTSGDITGDAILDLVATDNIQLGGDGLFKLYRGVENGMFETSSSWNFYGGYGSAVALADIDGDRRLDLATGGWWGQTNIFFNTGSGFSMQPDWISEEESVIEKIVFGDVGPTYTMEHSYQIRYEAEHDRSLFYLPHQQLQSVQKVISDDVELGYDEYTYSREHGWLSLNGPPLHFVEVWYDYSHSLDMVVSNWGPSEGNFLYYNRLFDADLECEGTLNWNNVKPGSTARGTLKVSNTGIPGSMLNWKVDTTPEWGVWTITPESGTDLTPEAGPTTLNVEVEVPLDEYQNFTGNVTLINERNSNDICIIQISLSTPLHISIYDKILHVLNVWRTASFSLLNMVITSLLKS